MPNKDPEIGHKGKHFSSTYQPVHKIGKKPNLIKRLKDVGLSYRDINVLLQNLVLSTPAQADELLKDPEIPLLALGYLKALKSDLAKGKADTFELVLDRLIGKPTQVQQINANVASGKAPIIVFGDADEAKVAESLESPGDLAIEEGGDEI